MSAGFCKRPDRDAPGIECGYPLPCPWHTVVVQSEEQLDAVLDRRGGTFDTLSGAKVVVRGQTITIPSAEEQKRQAAHRAKRGKRS